MLKKVMKNTTKTGRKKRTMFQIQVRQISGRGEGITDETITDISACYDKIYENFSKADQKDKDELVEELNKIVDELGDNFASGDKDDFIIACTDVNNKTFFVELLVDYGLEVEINERVQE